MIRDKLKEEEAFELKQVLDKYKAHASILVRLNRLDSEDDKLYALERKIQEKVNYYIAKELISLIRQEAYSEFYNEIKSKDPKSLSSIEKDFSDFMFERNREIEKLQKVWNNIFGLGPKEDIYLYIRAILQYGSKRIFETKEHALSMCPVCFDGVAKSLIKAYDDQQLETILTHHYHLIDVETAFCETPEEIEEVIKNIKCLRGKCEYSFGEGESRLASLFIEQKAKKMYNEIKELNKTIEKGYTL